MNAITITTCKRLDFFNKTISSFKNHFLDLDLIDIIIHYDDCSSEEDRKSMENTLNKEFPNKLISHRYFDSNSFESDKRHMEIMKIWKSDLESLNIKYVFHTEDDWLYKIDFSISDAIDLIKSKPEIAQVTFSQELRRFPKGMSTKYEGDFWEWLYFDNINIQANLFLDEVEMELVNVPGYWCYFINWPHFGFRPGIIDVDRLKKLDNFNGSEESFELEFAKRYSKHYKTYCYKHRVCDHLGWDDKKSSYALNNSKR